MNETKTVNRGWLKRQVERGNVEAKCDYHFTDDYAFDNAIGFGKTDWLPTRISHPTYKEVGEPGHERTISDNDDFVEGVVNFRDWDFKTQSGAAYCRDGETDIRLRVHSNLVYTLRIKA